MKTYNEYGGELKAAEQWYTSGSLIISFSPDVEPENFTELFISDDYEVEFDEEYLTDEQVRFVEEYALDAVFSIKQERAAYADQLATERWLTINR